MSRLNQSIEAFVYCVLGAQVNTRSSIIDNGGRAKETQSEFLVLLKGAIRSPDISKSIQRYQLAVGEAKARLDFAVVPGCWLMPSRMILNTESTVGYNNKLKQATQRMKLGVNNDVNQRTKKRHCGQWTAALVRLTRQTATHQTPFTNRPRRLRVWVMNIQK